MWKTAALLVAVGGYAWIASGVRTFSAPASVLTALVLVFGAVLLGIQTRLGEHAPGFVRRGRVYCALSPNRSEATSPTRSRPSVLGWAGVVVAILTWELINLFETPRRAHPTLSSLINGFAQDHWSRALLYAGWLVLGSYLSRR
jgi:hypothetical protein